MGTCVCDCVASNEDLAEKPQQEKNKTKKGSDKYGKETHARSKDKKKEVWESKWAILIRLEMKIYACKSIRPILLGL